MSYVIAFLATIFRYYDYALFGLSASHIAKHLMPPGPSEDKLLKFFMVFSLAVLARPMGSLIFGHIADKVGRTASFKITNLIGIISVLFISLLPDYQYLGIWSIVILGLARMLFLMSLAAEVDNIKVYIMEKTRGKFKHFASALVSISGQMGALLAAFMYQFSLSLSEISWLWRVNFFIGAVFGLMIFFCRNFLTESSYYLEAKSAQHQFDDNILKIIAKEWKKFLSALILSGGIGASYNFLIIFLGSFLASINETITLEMVAKNNVFLIMTYAVGCFFSGVIADRIYKTSVQAVSALLLTILLLPVIGIMFKFQSEIFYVQLIAVFLVPFYAIPIQVKLQNSFEPTLRVSLYSLSHSVGSMIFSATMPAFCMLIWWYTGSFMFLCAYFAVLISLMLLALVWITGIKKGKFSDAGLDP